MLTNFLTTTNQDKPDRKERANAKKTDAAQPDDEEVEEEFEVDENECKPPTRPASKLDLEEPISTSQNEDDENGDDDDDEQVGRIFFSRFFEIGISFSRYFQNEPNADAAPKDGARKRKPRKD